MDNMDKSFCPYELFENSPFNLIFWCKFDVFWPVWWSILIKLYLNFMFPTIFWWKTVTFWHKVGFQQVRINMWTKLPVPCSCAQGGQKIWKKSPNFSKSSPKSLQVKKGQNIYNKAQFESQKHLHQTTFETSKNQQQTMFWNCLFRWICNKFATAKKQPKMLPFLLLLHLFKKS